MLFLSTLLISIVITIVVMPHSRELAVKLQATDKPGGRKIHETVMPKCGGLAMAVGACVPVILWAPRTHFVKGLMIGSLIIVLFGLADDIKDLKPHVKLIGQTMAALVVTLVSGIKISDLGQLWPTGALLPDWAAIPLTLLVIVGVTNATNLSDGLDGLAGGIALMVFLCLGYLGMCQSDWVVVMMAIAVGGSILGFLRFNSYPAQLFMGDAGSQLLGFVAVVLSLKLAQQSANISVVLPLIIFGIPILDTLAVMIRRILKGCSPFSADRNHFHHQLIAIGLYHTEAVLTIYLVQSLLIVFAITHHGLDDRLLLGIYLLFTGMVLCVLHQFQRTGYKIDRGRFLTPLKTRMKPLKDRGQIIRITFGIVKVGVPALLIFNTLFQPPGSRLFSLIFAGILLLLIIVWFFNKSIMDKVGRVVLYFFTPFIIFRCDLNLNANINHLLIVVYNLLYLIMLASVFLTMKLTRRSNGFKSSTLDFLAIFVILLIPNLPNSTLQGYMLGLVAVKTIIMYYSYEVLIGELRRESMHVTISSAIFLFCLKGMIGNF